MEVIEKMKPTGTEEFMVGSFRQWICFFIGRYE